MQVKEIKLSEIATSPLNPRKTFDDAAIKELADSIAQNGLLQAITLRKKKGENGTKYEIVCGECRYRAHLLLGVETIEAIVKDLDDKQAFACMVIENLQRKDIDPLEEAAALKHLYSVAKVSVKEISKMLGKSQSFVVGRIQLNNISADFVSLLRDGTLNLMHLQEISKLTQEQQKVLWEQCFQPANIERWTFKTLKVETLREWIDEHVMGALSAARFDVADETYSTCKACKSCKFNTATYPTRFKDGEPRCMKVALFRAKNQEAVLRKAKELGYPLVYAGTPAENKEIVDFAQKMLLYPQPLGKREYLVEPVAPPTDTTTDPAKVAKRMANYERVRAVFDENIEAGYVVRVFEISYKGILTGEVKYLYNLQADENGDADHNDEELAESLSQFKMELRAVDERKQVERVERQRQFMENTSYAVKEDEIDNTEESIFLSLLTSRLPQEFRKNLGLDFECAVDVTASFSTLHAKKSSIMREFIRVMLSDKSVGYSNAFASLLNLAVTHSYGSDAEAIETQLTADYQQKCSDYEARIAELEKKLQEKSVTDTTSENEEVA